MKSFCQSGLCHWEGLLSNIQSCDLLRAYSVQGLAGCVLPLWPCAFASPFHESHMRPSCVWGRMCVCTCAQSLHLCPTLRPHGQQRARLLCPWDSLSNTGVGCHTFLRGSSQSKDQSHIFCVSHIAGGFFTTESPGKPLRTAIGPTAFWASKAECLYVWVWVGLSGFKSWLCDLGQFTEPLCDLFIMYKMKAMTNMNLTHRLIAWTKWYACARHCARHIQNYSRHTVRVPEMLAIVMTYLFVL